MEKAYEYGEIINAERIKGIRLRDGQRLSLKEYDSYRKGESIKASKRRFAGNDRRTETKRQESDDSNSQYEELKKKAISEMTDNEFNFFMLMKEREMAAAEKASEKETASKPTEQPSVEVIVIGSGDSEPRVVSPSSAETILKGESFEVKRAASPRRPERVLAQPSENPGLPLTSDARIQEMAKSLIEAELAASYLHYLNNKSPLTSIESKMLDAIEEDSEWQDKLDEVVFLNRAAQKALERVYLYDPDSLSDKLGLEFDKNADLDFLDLMSQLHRKIGNDVRMGDFRVMVDTFGERGGRAIKEILESYDAWEFVVSREHRFVTK